VTLGGGEHALELRRGGGSLDPGDGYGGFLGPLALERIVPRRLISVPPGGVGRLCGRPLDWLERWPDRR
jgi:hypothetical protein